MIPKIIHYCWVGGAPKPQSVLYCIESWKKYCPDYEIREWNENNYDFNKNKYMKQAYEAKKWGFVPDYARLDIVYEHGGIYLDTDVELVSSFDHLLENNAFMGFENTGDGEFFVNCGHGFGAEPKHPIIKHARDLYETLSFCNEDGSLNMLPSPHFTTQSLCDYGLRRENEDQELSDLIVYASDVLCPKNFRTGELRRTDRTVSIHHFTASWLDEKIKNEMLHQQKIRHMFGEKIGGYVLIIESVLKKYRGKELIIKLPVRICKKIKQKIICLMENIPYYINLLYTHFKKSGTDNSILLDTSMDSDNLGDQIIMENCIVQLSKEMECHSLNRVATHRAIREDEKDLLLNAKNKILCGTNILSGKMRSYGLWRLGPDVTPYKNIILMGVGFDSKNQATDLYTKLFFKTILDKKYLHSVRDSFSEKMLKDMGIGNVLYTGCPTMWKLTPELCILIPKEKAENVVCTLTDYNQDVDNDKKMLDILICNYKKVYFWLQGANDLDYLKQLGYEDKVIIVDASLNAFDDVLKQDNLDYVGTRLHAGIRALAAKKRSIIISIDNRAECIAKDTKLPIVQRKNVYCELEKKILDGFEIQINMPWDNIECWKKQW